MVDEAPDRAAIQQRYQLQLGSYEALRTEVLFMLDHALRAAGVKVHSVAGRVKTLDSLVRKVERKQYVDPFLEAEDLVGCRVVSLFQSDLERVRNVIRATFAVIREEDKLAEAPSDTFGYMSTHFICRIRPEHAGPRYDSLKSLTFEIQSRTIVMDAWASISHYLAYKGEASIPSDLKRDFHALSGLFYVADKHFEMFFLRSVGAQEAAMETVGHSEGGSWEKAPINRDTVMALLRNLYPERKPADQDDASEFAEEITAAGYEDLADIGSQLERAQFAAIEYEREYPPGGGTNDGRFAAVGLARQALAIADPRYAAAKYEDDNSFEPYRARLLGGPPRSARRKG